MTIAEKIVTENNLDSVLATIEQLSTKDLLAVQARIVAQLQYRLPTETTLAATQEQKIGANGHSPVNNDDDDEPDQVPLFPGSQLYHYTEKGRKKALAKIFTPERLAEIEKFDPASLPETSIPMSEMVNILRGKVEE